MRKYVSGTSWCVFRWTEVDSGYITRLHLLKTPWFAIDVHWINKPDAEPWLHDHPVTFLSIILRGGYTERRAFIRWGQEWEILLTHRWFNFIRASKNDRHRIAFVLPHTITLCFMGPKTREWGFHINGSWVHWKAYYTLQREGWIK